MWKRKEKSGRLGNCSGGRFPPLYEPSPPKFHQQPGWQRPVAAATITSPPEKNSELADLPVIVLLSLVPAAHPASAQGHNDVIRNLDNTISPDDA
jgi:hypothetical protein